jgi:hypothetical protein
MITLNKKSPDYKIKLIVHKSENPERVGKIMTEEELHDFGIGLFIAFFNNQRGKILSI